MRSASQRTPRRSQRDRSRLSASRARGGEADARSRHLDGGLLGSASLLIFLGVVMSYSVTAPLALEHALPPHFLRHLFALGLGVTVALIVGSLPMVTWRRIALPLWAAGIALLVATALFGVQVNGARRWLELPIIGLRFQPVELAKYFTLLAVASVVAPRDGRQELASRQLWTALALVLAPVLLLLGQPDFGNAVLLTVLVALVLVIAGAPLRRVFVLGTVLAGGAALYIATNAYALRRLVGFLDPWRQSQGAGFQLVQSFVAFGKGGWLGVGLGDGRQKLFYLPKAHTDFILSLVAEELGLIGVLVVLGAFAGLVVAGTRVARRARDRFSLLLAFAMTALLTAPAAINAAVVMGLLPTKGLTLPFLSYGGTSLVVCCAALGMLVAISQLGTFRDERVAGANPRGLAWH